MNVPISRYVSPPDFALKELITLKEKEFNAIEQDKRPSVRMNLVASVGDYETKQ